MRCRLNRGRGPSILLTILLRERTCIGLRIFVGGRWVHPFRLRR
jgi:hypothetical protein